MRLTVKPLTVRRSTVLAALAIVMAVMAAVLALSAARAQTGGGIINTVAGDGTPDFGGDGGPGTEAQINLPVGVTVTSDGGFLIADNENDRIRKVSSDGTISTVAGSVVTGGVTGGFSGDSGPATSAKLNGPHSISETPDGGFLIADRYNNRIRKVSPDGTISTVAGNGTSGFSGDGGPATSAKLSAIAVGVAAKPDGGFLIADLLNNRIREVSPDGTISTVAGSGTPGVGGFSGDGGSATSAQLDRPGRVAVMLDGGFLIADTFNNRIRKVSSDGTISTVAGNGSGSGGFTGDGGPATSAQLKLPHGVDATSDGGFLIADTYHYAIRKVSPDGTISTVAGNGSGSGGFTGDGGPATSAALSLAHAVAAKPDGGFLIADTYNHRVRAVDGSNEPPTVDAGGPYDVEEGDSVEVQASGNDPEGESLSYEWDLDGDDTFETSGQSVSFSAANLDGPSSRTIGVRVTDADGESATDEATVNVSNADPTATFGSPSQPVEEGDSFSLSLDDPSDASEADGTAGFEYAFDCGDGYGAFGSESTTSCSTDDNGTRSVKGTVRDKDGGTSEYTASVDVKNVAPTITGISGPSETLLGKKVSFTASATDPSSKDTFSWQWAVDGGTYSSGDNPFSTTFSSCGGHTVSAKARDDDGGESEPVTSSAVSLYEAHFRSPLNEGVYNTVQSGRVVPVKISIGCNGTDLTGLQPAIQLLTGDRTAGGETSSEEVETLSSSAADTTGVMRSTGGGYIYNLKVPSNASEGDLFTIRVRPFGDSNSGAGMYIVLKVRK